MQANFRTACITYIIFFSFDNYFHLTSLQELKVRRAHVVLQLRELQDKVQPILEIMENDTVMQNMEKMRDSKALINYLSKEFNVCALLLCVSTNLRFVFSLI